MLWPSAKASATGSSSPKNIGHASHVASLSIRTLGFQEYTSRESHLSTCSMGPNRQDISEIVMFERDGLSIDFHHHNR